MAARKTPQAGRRRNLPQEVLPTHRLIASESARATVVAVLIGCALALGIDLIIMVVGNAASNGSAAGVDRFGRGIVAAAVAGIVVFGIVAGMLVTIERLALADFYARLDPRDSRLKRTLVVRGQLSPSPYDPAMASAIGLGSLALLAAIPCIVLAAEHIDRADDQSHRSAAAAWSVWAAVFVAISLGAALLVWWFSRQNRRWRHDAGAQLGPLLVGHRRPAVRISSRAQRREARRHWSVLERLGWWGRVLLVVGAGAVVSGIFLHQPGLYAAPVGYSAEVERVIAGGTIGGGALLAIGFAVVVVVGSVSAWQTIGAMRAAANQAAANQAAANQAAVNQAAVNRAAASRTAVANADRERVLTATTTLSELTTTGQAWWTICAVIAAGGWFAVLVETPADTGVAVVVPAWITGPAGLILVILWGICGAALVSARVLLQTNGPAIRNRFGYRIPIEADDREFPDLPLFGQ